MLAINIRSVRLVSLITRNYCEGSFGVADDRDRRRTRREGHKREETGVRKIATLDRETRREIEATRENYEDLGKVSRI